jgi:hypothetical protein
MVVRTENHSMAVEWRYYVNITLNGNHVHAFDECSQFFPVLFIFPRKPFDMTFFCLLEAKVKIK